MHCAPIVFVAATAKDMEAHVADVPHCTLAGMAHRTQTLLQEAGLTPSAGLPRRTVRELVAALCQLPHALYPQGCAGPARSVCSGAAHLLRRCVERGLAELAVAYKACILAPCLDPKDGHERSGVLVSGRFDGGPKEKALRDTVACLLARRALLSSLIVSVF